MKLLFDENLSPTLPGAVSQEFPESKHIRDVGLRGKDDFFIWQYAAIHKFTLVSKDDDFVELSILRGAPPKVVLIRLGNCRTTEVANLLIANKIQIHSFVGEETTSLLELS